MLRILVAIPADTRAQSLIEWTRRIEDELRTPPTVTLLHVVPTEAQGVVGTMEAEVAGDLGEFNSTIEQLTRGRPEAWSIRVQAGVPEQIICALAVDFDLVVMGGHARSQLSELVFGSVSAWVEHHAPCPVLFVPRP